MQENQCIICGCTDNKACITEKGPCSWANEEKTICSACAENLEIARLEEEIEAEFLKYHLQDDYINEDFDNLDFLENVADMYQDLLILKGKL